MHSLIADVIDSYGGSDILIRTLNPLGVCSSVDTLFRVVQHMVNQRELLGSENELNDTSLIIMFMHTYSGVYCVKTQEIISWDNNSSNPTQSLVLKNRTVPEPKLSAYPSPNKSCISPVPKVRRRARSGLEKKTIHEPVSSSESVCGSTKLTASTETNQALSSETHRAVSAGTLPVLSFGTFPPLGAGTFPLV